MAPEPRLRATPHSHRGSSADTRPPAGPGPASRSPPSSVARSRIEAMPTPGRQAPVWWPWSVTSSRSAPAAGSRRTDAVGLVLCRATLVSASVTMR